MLLKKPPQMVLAQGLINSEGILNYSELILPVVENGGRKLGFAAVQLPSKVCLHLPDTITDNLELSNAKDVCHRGL